MEQDDEHDGDGAETLDVRTETSIFWRGSWFVAREPETVVRRCLVADHHLRRRDPYIFGRSGYDAGELLPPLRPAVNVDAAMGPMVAMSF